MNTESQNNNDIREQDLEINLIFFVLFLSIGIGLSCLF